VSGNLHTLEFCSKTFYTVNNTLQCTRDFRKILATRQFFSKKNAHILRDPAIHRMAILLGLQSEAASVLLEDIVCASVPDTLDPRTHHLIDEYIQRSWLPKSTDYSLEPYIN